MDELKIAGAHVVLDTNILISAALTPNGNPRKVVDTIRDKNGILLSSAMKNHQAFRTLAVAVFTACLFGAGTANAQENRRGFYIGIDTGVANSARLGSSVSAVTTPTKCDRLVYDDPVMVPSSAPECMVTTPRQLSSNGFEPGAGFTGGLSIGYVFQALRFELAYRIQGYGNNTSPLVESTTNQAVVSKASEWSNVYPPTETISDYRAHQVFANVYYDFRNNSPWTPSVGAGVGMARTNLNYNRRLLRKTIAEGYQDVEPPATIADRPLRAAGTFSMLDATVNGTIIGFQVLAGADYAVGERTTIGLTAHWTRFGTLTEDVVWSIIRSHAPVRADGVTPFSGELAFDSFESLVATLGLKYRF